MYARLAQRLEVVVQHLIAAALVEVGYQHQRGVPGVLNLLGRLLEREVDMRAAAQLRAHQHLERVVYPVGQVEHAGIEGQQVDVDVRQTGEDRRQDRTLHHRIDHRAGLV